MRNGAVLDAVERIVRHEAAGKDDLTPVGGGADEDAAPVVADRPAVQDEPARVLDADAAVDFCCRIVPLDDGVVVHRELPARDEESAAHAIAAKIGAFIKGDPRAVKHSAAASHDGPADRPRLVADDAGVVVHQETADIHAAVTILMPLRWCLETVEGDAGAVGHNQRAAVKGVTARIVYIEGNRRVGNDGGRVGQHKSAAREGDAATALVVREVLGDGGVSPDDRGASPLDVHAGAARRSAVGVRPRPRPVADDGGMAVHLKRPDIRAAGYALSRNRRRSRHVVGVVADEGGVRHAEEAGD